MNAKKRYGFILTSVILLTMCFFWGSKFREKRRVNQRIQRKSYMHKYYNENSSPILSFSKTVVNHTYCSMESCFDYSKCSGKPFKVYVYPDDDNVLPSSSYMKIIGAIKDSKFYTRDASQACVFVLSLDTLDRDPLSQQDFIRNMQARVDSLQHWNSGLNHIIFNLYSGTWPDYNEELGFNIGKAMLAKASIATENFRPGFDISLPLFHKNHPERGGGSGMVKNNNFPVHNKYFLAFKGKRYVHGIGSDTRNSLHHLNNGEEVVMVTTCRHGKNWREMMDERCEEDNAEYERWDYGNLLSNSTFCLVPRGRRLGSFRFLETLQAGCLPVILSNGWELPFDEVIDWSQASISVDERQLMQVPEILRTVTAPEVFSMRQQTQVVWEQYLSSVEKIVMTTIHIVRERVHPHLARSSHTWNSSPGALWSDDTHRFVSSVGLVPLGYKILDVPPVSQPHKFTAVISVSSSLVTSSSPVFTLLNNLSVCDSLAHVIILWSSEVTPPPPDDWIFLGRLSQHTPLKILHTNTSSTRFSHATSVSTDAVLFLDESVKLTTEETEFAFEVWKTFPDRIVGFSERNHFWDEKKKMWQYSSALSNEYSMILTNAAFVNRKYAKHFVENLSVSLTSAILSHPDCEHILMNFLVSKITQLPPVKVTHKRDHQDVPDFVFASEQFAVKQRCMNIFRAGFGHMPLVRSQVRLDPVLFKDPVANMRKKYRKIELVQ